MSNSMNGNLLKQSSVQSIRADNFVGTSTIRLPTERESNIGFVEYVLLMNQLNDKRNKMNISWKTLAKLYPLDLEMRNAKKRCILLAIGRMIARNQIDASEIIGFRPSCLKLITRFPNHVQDEIIRREIYPAQVDAKKPSHLSFSRLRRLALELCHTKGISYRKSGSKVGLR
jgi:hypothetical protein